MRWMYPCQGLFSDGRDGNGPSCRRFDLEEGRELS